MTDLATTTNAYWEAVAAHATPSTYTWDHGALHIGAPTNDPEWWRTIADRTDLCSRYSWTITDPDTVAFVVQHSRGAVIDPMAGSGWWAHLLTQAGVDVVASDLHPPGSAGNHWHKHDTHHPIQQANAAGAVAGRCSARTLLLSWPPYDDTTGADILAATTTDRVIYIGENAGGCCGNDDMFDLLDQQWAEVACHRPVQWYGIHDFVTVYDRKN